MTRKDAIRFKPDILSGWVECKVAGAAKLTKGKKYKIINHHLYLNKYRTDGENMWVWDEFLTLKNDENWTVKVSRYRFQPCEAPISDKHRINNLEKEVERLKNLLL